MSKTKIEWATTSWNPITGCSPISEGCANCYAARMARRLAGRYGYPKDDPFKVTFHPDKMDEPNKWKSSKVFVCSMGDLFHEDVKDWMLDKVFDVVCNDGLSDHTWMILTKRPIRMAEYISRDYISPFIPSMENIWLGVTAENQRTADERIPILLQIPAAVRFVSVEPMMGPVDLKAIRIGTEYPNGGDNPEPYCIDAFKTILVFGDEGDYEFEKLDWVICGPETGPHARECKREWVADLYEQCRAAGVPFFDKKGVLGETIQEWPR